MKGATRLISGTRHKYLDHIAAKGTAKPYLIICWLCRTIAVANGQRKAEQLADEHSLSVHRRGDWFPFMVNQTVESIVEDYDGATLFKEADL